MAWETWLTVSDGVAWVWRQEKRQIQDEMILVAYTVYTVCCLETRKFDLKWGWQIRVSNLAISCKKYINTYTAIYNNDKDDIDDDTDNDDDRKSPLGLFVFQQ